METGIAIASKVFDNLSRLLLLTLHSRLLIGQMNTDLQSRDILVQAISYLSEIADTPTCWPSRIRIVLSPSVQEYRNQKTPEYVSAVVVNIVDYRKRTEFYRSRIDS